MKRKAPVIRGDKAKTPDRLKRHIKRMCEPGPLGKYVAKKLAEQAKK